MVVPAKAGTAVAGDYTTPGDRSFLLCNYCFLVSLPEPLPIPPPLLPPVLGAGVGVGLVVELPELLPPVELLPLAPAPAPLRLSCRHFSRSVPVRLTHLAGISVDAPAAPLAPEPDEPDEEPVDWAIATEDRASAAAAAVSIFNIM